MYKNKIKYHFNCFGTLCEISFAHELLSIDLNIESIYQNLAQLMKIEAIRIQEKFSRYNQSGFVYDVNKLAGTGTWSEADEETIELLKYAQNLYEISDGLFDVTSGVLRKIWNFKLKEPALPHQELVNTYKSLVNFNHINIEGNKVRLQKSHAEIDFGGFGKEYAVDRCVDIFIKNIPEYLQNTALCLNFGGDIFCIGNHQNDKKGWAIAVANPIVPVNACISVMVNQQAITTSGDYERSFVLNGKKYGHILNPKTAYPVDYWSSISVISSSCLASGAISTIAMLKEDKALDFLEEQNIPYLAIKIKKGQLKFYKNKKWLQKEK